MTNLHSRVLDTYIDLDQIENLGVTVFCPSCGYQNKIGFVDDSFTTVTHFKPKNKVYSYPTIPSKLAIWLNNTYFQCDCGHEFTMSMNLPNLVKVFLKDRAN